MPYDLYGLSPKNVIIPGSLTELARLVDSAAKENAAIIPWGGGTMQHLGNAPRRYDVAIDLKQLNHIVEYSPDDLTITVEAGATISAIQTELARHGQYLPLDPPLPALATIGGTLATNSCGPLRLRYGTARDFTLGMTVVNAEGRITKSGGKVVKNVAGYEMAKLNIGAFGSLGVVAQATFKVLPRFKEEITLMASFGVVGNACKVVKAFWNLTTTPLAIELFDAKLAHMAGLDQKENNWVVAVRFGGSKTVVDAAAGKANLAAQDAKAATIEMISGEPLWLKITDMPAALREANASGTLLRIGLPPSRLGSAIEKIGERASAVGLDTYGLFAHAATATLYVSFDADEEKTVEEIKHWRWALARLDAHLVIEHAPRAVKEKISVWGEPGPEHFIAQRLKEKFDPQWILNPGRFVGGL